jgi:hypothetical protein
MKDLERSNDGLCHFTISLKGMGKTKKSVNQDSQYPESDEIR